MTGTQRIAKRTVFSRATQKTLRDMSWILLPRINPSSALQTFNQVALPYT
jgi:hypothetical protein